MKIDNNLCRLGGKEVVVGHHRRKQPPRTEKERPRLNAEERRFAFLGEPCKHAKETRDDGEEAADGDNDCAHGKHV